MAPTPQEHSPVSAEIVPPQNLNVGKIVISGMSGLYPKSHNVKEFSEILYSKVSPLTAEDVRFKYNHPEVVQHAGSIPGLGYFDAQFFKVHYRLANSMDPMGQKVLEQAYQAIYDAGVNPDQLSGKKVGVYIGSCFSETEKACFYEAASRTGFGIAGCSKTMFANRISYWLNAKGPSMAIDEACCSSTAALEQAYLAISRGECEAAIVGGSYLCLHPQSSVHFGRIIKLCTDGKTKSFDENADGCAKSEAINILFLQKGSDALRIYAEVLQAKTEFTCMLKEETGPKYGFYRSLSSTTNFIKKIYEDAKVSPQAIEYVEAFGCALPEADKVELQAIEEVFCKNRDDPLLIGSVMSNIGYGEAASGISAITKVLLGYHTGKLAANLHCKNPRKDIVALRDGRMRIITEHQSFRNTYVAVNGMSMTGVNSHVLLHGHNKPKDLSRYKSSIPYLVNISGRHDEAVKAAIDILKTNPIDAEQVALLHNIHKTSVSGHMGRGFVILKSGENQETVSVAERAQYFDDAKRPLWFVYSGMGSQWAGMGEQLMRIPIFAAAIERCNRVLAPKGLDILHIITSPDEKMFNNILHSFVGIAAIQIGLTDILRELGLTPDGIIGHSVGELGCAYADGCLTAEEMILSAYYRGLVSLETKFILGSMAAVGIGYERVKEICPPEIDVACHNSSESSTISGPADVMKAFVAELTAKEIFAKEVPCSNIAYHSRYIASAGPHLLKYLKQSIRSPKARSERWISSSVPQDRWDEPIAKTCSPEYLTNNLLSPVLFEETSRLIPNNAVLVEIAPHGLLQAILKRSMPSSCKNIPLTRRKHPDNTLMLLEAIGQLYVEGFNSNIQVLYPRVEMPVSNGTPFLSHFVKWAHGEKWPLAIYHSANRRKAAICDFVVALQDKEHSYLEGHSIRGSTLYPFAACLTLAWDTLAMIMNVPRKQLSVQFNDIELHVQPVLHKRRQLKLNVSIHRGTGRFEILADDLKVVTGFINAISRKEKFHTDLEHVTKTFNLSSEDIYQLFRDREYLYSGEFQSIQGVDESLSEALIVWRNNWVTFIDGILQLNALRQPHNAVTLVTRVRKIIINVIEQTRAIDESKTTGDVLMKAKFYEEFDNTRCGGVLIENVKFQNLPPVKSSKAILKTLAPASTGNSGQESYVPVKESQILTDNVILQSEESGSYESLKWVAAPALTGPGVTVTVHYAGINSNDVKKANGSLLFNLTGNNYGSDFSGITNKGERVMGILPSGSACSQIRVQPDLLWQVPAHWSLEDAATVPLAYAQAFYCLAIKTKLDKSMTVLVHGGAGALGQAVISIALAIGCEIFTTVSDLRKKRFLQKVFPSLKDDHIGCSRDHTFADTILIASKNRGCDIIISCLKEDLKTINMNCMNYSGILLDISQLQNYDNYSLGMSNLQKERNYISVDFSSIFKNSDDIKIITKMIAEGIATGYIRPLTRVTYPAQEPARAFQLLAKSQHRGRVLLRIKDNVIQAQQRLRCSADRCHLIFCNEAMFRLQLADILVSRGVRKLYLHVKKQSFYLHHKMRLWRAMGVEVVVSSVDLNERNITTLLNDTLKLGALEGVYLTVSDKNDRFNDNLIKLLDSAVRKLSTELRYFCVLNIGDHSTGKDVCVRRSSVKLPATVLTVPELKEDFSRWHATMDALEQALLSNHSVFRAEIDEASQPSLLQLLATITGIHIPDNVDKNLTLQDLGIEQHKLPLICAVLKLQYNIKFDEEHLSSLTLEALCALEQKVIELPYDEVKGLSTFFNYVGLDELLATTDMVLMPTLGISESMRDDEFDPDKEYLCIVPGMEGHHERFRVLCERSKLPALVLQPGLDRPDETVKETAERFAELLLKKTGLKNSFYLMGYESGVLVALEIAAILEGHGLTGTVFCLGYGPNELVQELEEHLKQYENEDQLQDGVLRHMFALMAKDDTARLESTLKNVSTWSEKIDACVRILLGRVSHSAQYARALIECALGRINQVRRNKSVAKPLRSRLVLLQAATEQKRSQNTLQQYSQQPIAVHQLGTSLAHCAEDLSCAAIINEYLDPAIIENFSKLNILETYLLNANSFMAKDVDVNAD